MVAKEGGGRGEELGAWISTGMVWLKTLKNKVKKSFFKKDLDNMKILMLVISQRSNKKSF